MSPESKCPVIHSTRGVKPNQDWWPNQLNLKVLHQNCAESNPMGATFKERLIKSQICA